MIVDLGLWKPRGILISKKMIICRWYEIHSKMHCMESSKIMERDVMNIL